MSVDVILHLENVMFYRNVGIDIMLQFYFVGINNLDKNTFARVMRLKN